MEPDTDLAGALSPGFAVDHSPSNFGPANFSGTFTNSPHHSPHKDALSKLQQRIGKARAKQKPWKSRAFASISNALGRTVRSPEPKVRDSNPVGRMVGYCREAARKRRAEEDEIVEWIANSLQTGSLLSPSLLWSPLSPVAVEASQQLASNDPESV